jgi:hypothetical protein
MHDDPIVDEIHKIREQLLEHGGLDGYCRPSAEDAGADEGSCRQPRAEAAYRYDTQDFLGRNYATFNSRLSFSIKSFA